MGVDLIVLQQLAVSFGLGLLLGLQRERAESSIGGIRTFPLIAIFGTVCALLGKTFGGWMVAAGLLALVAIVVYSNFAKIKSGDIDPGMTTEVAALLLYGLGAYVVIGSMVVTVVVGGAMAVLLQFKKPLHALAGAIGERDMRAIMQFVLLSLVILPVLPHQDFGPYGVWNPFQIWLMVVLIVGISLTGYIAYKCLGARRGYFIGRCSRRSYLQHGDDGELRAPHRGEHQAREFGYGCHRDCIMHFAGTRPGRNGGRSSSRFRFNGAACCRYPGCLHYHCGRGVSMAAFGRCADARAKKSSRIEIGVYFCRDLRRRPPRGRRRQGAFRLCRFLLGSHRFRTDRHGRDYAFVGSFG